MTNPTATTDEPLTDRETQVAELIAQALTDRQIAVKLHLSSFTVRWYVDNILMKLGAPNRVAICRWWFINHYQGQGQQKQKAS